MDDKHIVCQIKRSDRPCLICPGYMDLVQTNPPKFGLFSGFAFVCNSEAIDCLDCQKCGFQTTTDDYQYLMLCKKDRLTKGTFIDKRMNSPAHRRTNELSRLTRIGPRSQSSVIRTSSSLSQGRNCAHCQAPLESNAWQFCPKCGKQCPLPPPTIAAESLTSRRRESANRTTSAPVEIPTDIIIRSNSSMSSNSIQHNAKMDTESSKSTEDRIARSVTPSASLSANIDYLGPVEMQY